MSDIIIAIVLVAVIGAALFYIIKSKKSGDKCIGCPHSKNCGKYSCCQQNKKDEK